MAAILSFTPQCINEPARDFLLKTSTSIFLFTSETPHLPDAFPAKLGDDAAATAVDG